MRLLKAQNTNLRNIYGKGVRYDVNGQVVMDSADVLLIPKGATGDLVTTTENGHMRYNTTTNEFEFYQDGAFRKVKYKEPNRNPGIVVQTLGTGDDLETKFGTLDSGDTDYPIPESEAHILVLIENVLQIPVTNYTLEQNPAGNSPSTGLPYPAGWYLDFGTAVPLGKVITVIHNFDK